jgi:hypothetical protein
MLEYIEAENAAKLQHMSCGFSEICRGVSLTLRTEPAADYRAREATGIIAAPYRNPWVRVPPGSAPARPPLREQLRLALGRRCDPEFPAACALRGYGGTAVAINSP